MSLNRKTLLILAGAAAASFLVSFVIMRTIIYTSFLELENNRINADVELVQKALQSHFDRLSLVNLEYSQWDDMYLYMQSRDEVFITRNIDIEILNRVDLDFATILDTQGNMIFGIERTSDDTADFQRKNPFEESNALRDKIFTGLATTSNITGIVDNPLGPMLIVSRPVLHNDAAGPPVGSIIFGQVLTEQRIQAMGKELSIDFSFIPASSERLTENFRLVLESQDAVSTDRCLNKKPVQRLADNSCTALPRTQKNDSIVHYRSFPDIFGQPVYALEMVAARPISLAGKQAVAASLVFLAATSLFYLLISAVSLKGLIITPISKLALYVTRLQASGDLDQRISSNRNDEIGSLTNQIDSLVKALNEAQNNMTEARDTAMAASEAKSRFLANMSHEIRTPINGVLGMTELLLSSSNLGEKQYEYARMAYESGDALLSIINDILDFSKLEAGELHLESVNFDLQDFLHDTIELLTKQAQEKGLSLDCVYPRGTSLVVRGDPLRLRQILSNLIGNAIKFTEQGNVLLRVTAVNDGTEHLNVCFEIVDTGIGISPEQQKRIFDSFAQEDDSTTRRFGGTGLGLSISKQFVEAMDGTLRVASEPGKGSTFSFDLRMPAGDQTDLGVTKQFLRKKLSSLANKLGETKPLVGQILVADDNQVNQAVARFMLKDLGLKVEIAEDGDEAVEKFSSGSFDAILMDCHMPKLDGLQATQAIRQMESESGEVPIPIIAVTANAIMGESEKCIAAGMNDFLSKPYTAKQLYSILSKYLQHQA